MLAEDSVIVEFEVEAADIMQKCCMTLKGGTIGCSRRFQVRQSCRTFSINRMHEDVESLVNEAFQEIGISPKRFLDNLQGIPI